MNSIERKIVVGFGGTLMVLSALALATYLATAGFIEKSRRFHQTHTILGLIADIQRNTSVAQSGQRGFILTGQVRDLEAFQDALFGIDGLVKELRGMISDPEQLGRLKSLEPLLVRKIDLLKSALSTKSARGLAAATALLKAQDDTAVTKSIEDLVMAIKAKEDDLMRRQAGEVGEEAADLRKVVVAGIACNLVLFSLVYFLVHGEMKRRMTAEQELARQTSILSSVLRNMGDGVQAIDMEGRFLVSNPAAKQLLGTTPERLSREEWSDKLGIYHEDRSTHFEFEELPLVQALQGRDTDSLEVYIKSQRVPQGAVLSVSCRPLRGGDKRVVGGIAVYRNITEEKNAQTALLSTNTKLTELVEVLQQQNEDISALSDLVETLQACNSLQEVCKASSAVMSVLFRGSYGSVYTMSKDKERVERACTWGARTASEDEFPLERCWSFRRNQPNFSNADHPGKLCTHFGDPAPAEALCIPLAAHGEHFGMLEVCSEMKKERSVVEKRRKMASMIGEQIGLALANLRLRESLKNQSIHDPLTGLFNRRHMEESFEHEIAEAERAKASLCVAMLDVDHFKKFNDQFGHEAGDQVLKEISRVLKETLRRGDIVCRYGGEEMAVLMPQTSAGQARIRMDAIREAVAALRLTHMERSLGSLSVSIGISVFPEDGGAAGELLRRADEALYAAKQAGRNRVVLCHGLKQEGGEGQEGKQAA